MFSYDLSSCISNLLVNQTAPFGSPLRSYPLKLGQQCNETTECNNGAVCSMGVCACPPGTMATSIRGVCSPENQTASTTGPVALRLSRYMSSYGTGMPGTECPEDKMCRLGASCLLETDGRSYCVCEKRLVTNSTGHCTTKMLTDTMKSKFGTSI